MKIYIYNQMNNNLLHTIKTNYVRPEEEPIG